MKKIFNQIVDPNLQVIDITTGEIKSAVSHIKVDNIDDFIMIFLNNLRCLYNLEGLELKLLMQCWKKSLYANDYSGNILLNDNDFKKSVIDDGLKMSPATIDVYISKLCKKGLLIRLSKGKYMLNPNYFFKGRLSDRSKLKLEMSYNLE